MSYDKFGDVAGIWLGAFKDLTEPPAASNDVVGDDHHKQPGTYLPGQGKTKAKGFLSLRGRQNEPWNKPIVIPSGNLT